MGGRPGVDIVDRTGHHSTVPTEPEDRLDNAVWHALSTCHSALAEVAGAARRYPPDVSVFAAVDGLDPAAWGSLADLVGSGEVVALFRREIGPVPPRWRVLGQGTGNQFVATELAPLDAAGAPPVVSLGPDDAERMLALATLAQPGPFALRTSSLGAFVGVVEHGELIAMAGERLRFPGYTEVSAVCTHPSARRRGVAALLTHHVATTIQARGDTPFLHVAAANDPARRVYERLGFTLRTPVQFVAVTPQERP